MKRFSDYAETGTVVSGYSEDGPFHCEDCVHRQGGFCFHPMVVNDPARKAHKQGNKSSINIERGCCRYVRPPKDKSNG